MSQLPSHSGNVAIVPPQIKLNIWISFIDLKGNHDTRSLIIKMLFWLKGRSISLQTSAKRISCLKSAWQIDESILSKKKLQVCLTQQNDWKWTNRPLSYYDKMNLRAFLKLSNYLLNESVKFLRFSKAVKVFSCLWKCWIALFHFRICVTSDRSLSTSLFGN